MKILYLDLQMGAAGDMLAGALLGLLDEAGRARLLAELRDALPEGVETALLPAEQCGVTGAHFSVTVHGEEEHEPAEHAHHRHHHHHDHAGMAEIGHIVAHMGLEEAAAADVLAVYRAIAAAESEVHGTPVAEVHFHELGALDAVADVTATALALRALGAERIVASPVAVGSGTVRCAHGVLPVPAPATALLLRGVPAYAGEVAGELCTPTGAALIGYYVNQFGPMPVMCPDRVGYGFGTKEFPGRPNCVRAILGEAFDSGERRDEGETETLVELACNIDDMTPEDVGFALERVRAAGAVEAFTVAAGMKKDRPGVLLTALCREADREAVLAALFAHTTTLGVREATLRRYALVRETETVQTAFGPVRRKISHGFGVERVKWEYEDLAAVARAEGLTLDAVRRVIEADGCAD